MKRRSLMVGKRGEKVRRVNLNFEKKWRG